jgi:uncharacterized membrane protein YidH (DUF202 family)
MAAPPCYTKGIALAEIIVGLLGVGIGIWVLVVTLSSPNKTSEELGYYTFLNSLLIVAGWFTVVVGYKKYKQTNEAVKPDENGQSVV